MDRHTELSNSSSPSVEAPGEEAAGMAVSDVESSPLPPPPPPPPPKWKRGRPPKLQKGGRQPPVRRKEKEVEVVFFVCLEQAESEDLVACNRRGCFKVYHRECVDRRDAFFRSRRRWACSWHICSDCGKAARYMCYTCTYSLCKTCYRQAEFSCLRGNKGFCETCCQTLMLIESNENSCRKQDVDFDDKSSWEYLFKEYWSALKGKLSVTMEELSACKSPWKVSAHYEDSSEESCNANDDQEATSDSSSEYLDGSNFSRKKARRHLRNGAGYEGSLKQVESVEAEFSLKEADDKDVEWGSNELLEFVAHMKDGDTSWLSQFDVHALLLEYIKQNNLRDPHRKSQIICDSMLKNLFKKERVGHFEMLNLLESHFLMKGASQVTVDGSQGDFEEPDSGQTDAQCGSMSKISSDTRQTSYKKAEEREAQGNLADYAAIDYHNINKIYLRRSLMEDLLDSAGKFSDKVVGCFVRIRIPSTVQSQDMYRLVQVVGTSKGTVKYKIGKKTTDTLLKILNLQKTESLTANAISDQEFTKEECQRLRQCIKCGLLNRLTVGGVQEKARALQTLRINDWLANEKLRLGHLRDRASEKGCRKELRVCVEKLQLLNTSEEHRRVLHEVAEIHVDPRMDPSYESPDEEEFDDKDQGEFGDKDQENCNESRESSFREGRPDASSTKEDFGPSKDWTAASKISNASSEPNQSAVAEVAQATSSSNLNGVWKRLHTTWDTNTNMIVEDARGKIDSFSTYGIRTNELAQAQETDACHSSCRSPNVQAAIMTSGRKCYSNHPTVIPEKSHDAASFSTLVPPVSEIPVQPWISEIDNLWHYQDPYGIVQGPFSIIQLRRWSMTGFFPPDMRIWQTSEKPVDSILLADVLIGKLQKNLVQKKSEQNSDPQATQIATAMDNGQKILHGGWEGNSLPCAGSKKNTGQINASFFPSNIELGNGVRWMNNPAAWSAARAEVLPGWETAANAWVGHPQAHGSLRTAVPNSGNNYQPRPFHGRGGRRGQNSGRWNQRQDHGNVWNLNRPRGPKPSGQGYERQLSNWGSSGMSSGEPWKSRASNDSRDQWPNDSVDLSTPTPQPSSGGWANIQGAAQSASTHVGSGWDATTGSSSRLARHFPDGSMEPSKAAIDNDNGCCVSSSMSVMKQTDKTDGWGSWSVDSANRVKHTDGWSMASPKQNDNAGGWRSEPAGTPMLKKADETDGWGSWSAVSAKKVKHRDGWDMPLSKQTDNADGWHSEPAGTQMLKQTNKTDGWGSWSAASATNKVKPADGWGNVAPKQRDNAAGWCSEPGTPILDKVKMVETVDTSLAKDTPNSLHTEDAPQNLENQSAHCDDIMYLPNSAISVCGSGIGELNGAMDMNQMLQGDCCPTLLSVSQVHLEVQANESCPAFTSPAVEDVPNSTIFVSGYDGNGPSGAMSKNQLLQGDFPSPTPLSERQGEPVQMEACSTQRCENSSEPKLVSESQGSGPSEEHDKKYSTPSSAHSSRWKQNQTLRQSDTNGGQWSLSSPTPSTKPSGSGAGIDSTLNKGKQNRWITSDACKHPSSQLISNACIEPQQPLKADWVNEAQVVQSTDCDHLMVQKNSNRVTGTVSDVNESSKSDWGNSAPEGMNGNTGWDAPAPESIIANTNWLSPVSEKGKGKTGWESASQKSLKCNDGWGAAAPGNSTNQGWGALAQGSSNLKTGWGNTKQNLSWGASTPQENVHTNGGWGTGNGGHNWGTHHNQDGSMSDRDGYSSWNSRLQSRGGVASLPFSRGQGQVGVCKFHQSGYCKKGSSCNYLHT